jgi:hypothetical protein
MSTISKTIQTETNVLLKSLTYFWKNVKGCENKDPFAKYEDPIMSPGPAETCQ